MFHVILLKPILQDIARWNYLEIHKTEYFSIHKAFNIHIQVL